ncbi:hypothetical protein F4819DRAFT_275346 [Hypoxylon fuscum]|nr:hypothetical protein F4819DRAFT_275346 [Hypoxylon fuscum]
MIFSNLFTPAILALATSVAAIPLQLQERGEQIVIGYRRCAKEQAEDYIKAGTVTYDASFPDWGKQIGAGTYTTPGRDDYEPMADPDSWYCVISADKDRINDVSKAWIPKISPFDGKTKLWNQNKEDNINKYIKQLEDSWNPEKTIRMAYIAGAKTPTYQLLIPPKLHNDQGGALGITVKCSAKKDDIKDTRVDYDDWKDNIKGDKGSDTKK